MITVTGASDDLIEIAGDILEEFPYDDSDDGDFLAFSDGTVLKIRLASEGDGIWRITPIARGTGTLVIDQAGQDDSRYSDRADLDGNIRWVVHGRCYAKASR